MIKITSRTMIHSIIFFVRNLVCASNSMNQAYFNIGFHKHSWLIDTGASISAINYDIVKQHNLPYRVRKVQIKGIGGDVFSDGFIDLELTHDGESFHHTFHVFKNLPTKTDGIIGEDFLRKYFAKIDYEYNTLKLTNIRTITVPINQQSRKGSYLTVPSRSESIHFIDVQIKEECVVHSQELCDGVFVASALVTPRSGKIPIKILNTRESDVPLFPFMLNITKSSDYELCEFEKPKMNAERVKKLFKELNLNNLSKEEQISIENICAKFPDVFHLPGDRITVTKLYQQTISLKPGSTPVYVKPYRLPHAQKKELDVQVNKLLQDNIIEEATSEWSSPLLIVPKKSDVTGQKKWRVVIDYRKLNNLIQDDKFPLPNIVDILDSLSGAVYFSHLDLYQGYYQIELEKESRKYTAFTTNKNQYQMTRLPMGLKTSPGAFSRMMTVAMSGLNYEKCLVYLDDLCVFGRNLEQHNKNLLDVFGRLRKNNLKLNPSKCKFLRKEILYLGHVVSENGIQPDPDKTKVLKNYPKPKNADEVKRFVAFANYYRRFIKNFSAISYPLNLLCRKNVPFLWSHECDNAFETLKSSLGKPPVLQYPDFSDKNEFLLQTDASGTAIGSVLCNSDGRPVAYASRTLNKAERNYPTIEKELLAIVWSVKYFRPYLYGRKFKIQTDHRPLIYLFNMRDPSSRLLKFRLLLEEYNYVVEYIKGNRNSVADALSRITITSEQLKDMNEQIISVMTRAQSRKLQSDVGQSGENLLVDNVTLDSRTDHPRIVDIIKKPKNLTELRILTSKEFINMQNKGVCTLEANNIIFNALKSIIYICLDSRSLCPRVGLVRELGNLCKKYKLEEICIVKINDSKRKLIESLIKSIKDSKNWPNTRVYIIRGVQRIDDLDDRKVIINDFHLLPTSGHAGIKRMSNNIKRFYFWPSLEKDVIEFVSRCEKCQKHKYCIKTKQPMQITTTANTAFEKVYLDIVGPLPKDLNGFVYILTLQCELSKFIEAYPLVSKDAISVARCFVENFVLRYSVPKEIATDRGSEFISTTMQEVCKLLKIQQVSSTAYHHESIGALENTHKTMGAYLRINCEQHTESWSSWLPYWCFAYNNTVHSETNYTPHELVFGKIPNLPSNLMTNIVDPIYNHDNYALELKFRLQVAQKDAKNNLLQKKTKRKTDYDKRINPITYCKDDLLLLRNPTGNKLDRIYLGPYIVLEDLGVNVKINKNGKIDIVHKNRTKPFVQ